MPTAVPLAEVAIDPALQPREGPLDVGHVDEIAEAVRGGREVRRVKVVNVAGRLYVTDGNHTVRGYELLGRKAVPCAVTLGTWEDAVLAALAANQEHTALKRTNKDKRRAVEAALREFPRKSDQWLADACGVSRFLVQTVRPQVALNATSDNQGVREGTDGKLYPAARPHRPDGGEEADDGPAADDEGAEAPAPPRPGKALPPKFPWKDFETLLGQMRRLVDATANNLPGEKEGRYHRKAKGDLGDFLSTMTEWRDYAKNTKKAG